MARAERRPRLGEMLDRVGLSDAGEAPIRTYSRGMHRRLGLAQAFLTDPEVVLLDEPTAGLDAPGFGVLADLLGAARGRGATVVLASHVASDLIEHCDRLALLVRGEVQRVGTPNELLGDPEVLQLRIQGLSVEDAAALEAQIERSGLPARIRSCPPIPTGAVQGPRARQRRERATMTLPLLRLSARRRAAGGAAGVATVSLLAIAGHPVAPRSSRCHRDSRR